MINFKEFLENKKQSIFHVITGPLATGKSTFKKKLTKELKTPIREEYQLGVDISKANWWEELIEYAEDEKTKVVETHMNYKGYDAFDGVKIGKVKIPPSNIKIYVVLPDIKTLFKRQKSRDKYTTIETTKEEYEWYKSILKQMKSKRVN